ncbi:MAG TPA: hypothetical protein VIF15_17440 [Polyangiaceae bacterium]
MARALISKKLLVASIGVATVSYAGCGNTTSTPIVGNLMGPTCDASSSCGATDDGGGTTQDTGTPYTHPETGAPCTTSADCAAGLDCAYPIADGCSAKGTCIFALGVDDAGSGCATQVTCGCDGQTHRFLCYPTGYALTPTEAVGACEGGEVDAGGTDAGEDASDAAGDAATD